MERVGAGAGAGKMGPNPEACLERPSPHLLSLFFFLINLLSPPLSPAGPPRVGEAKRLHCSWKEGEADPPRASGSLMMKTRLRNSGLGLMAHVSVLATCNTKSQGWCTGHVHAVRVAPSTCPLPSKHHHRPSETTLASEIRTSQVNCVWACLILSLIAPPPFPPPLCEYAALKMTIRLT